MRRYDGGQAKRRRRHGMRNSMAILPQRCGHPCQSSRRTRGLTTAAKGRSEWQRDIEPDSSGICPAAAASISPCCASRRHAPAEGVSRPARRKISKVNPLRPNVTAVASAIRPSTNSGFAKALPSTSPISATANQNSTITFSPSIRSAVARPRPAGIARIANPTQPRRPASAPAASRARAARVSSRVRRTARPAPARETVLPRCSPQQRQRHRGVESHQGCQRRRGEGRRRYHVEHERQQQCRRRSGGRGDEGDTGERGHVSMVQPTARARSRGRAIARVIPRVRPGERETQRITRFRSTAGPVRRAAAGQCRAGSKWRQPWCLGGQARQAPPPCGRAVPSLRHNSRAGGRR